MFRHIRHGHPMTTDIQFAVLSMTIRSLPVYEKLSMVHTRDSRRDAWHKLCLFPHPTSVLGQTAVCRWALGSGRISATATLLDPRAVVDAAGA